MHQSSCARCHKCIHAVSLCWHGRLLAIARYLVSSASGWVALCHALCSEASIPRSLLAACPCAGACVSRCCSGPRGAVATRAGVPPCCSVHPMGGTAYLSLESPDEPFLHGVKFTAMPPTKRFRDMEQLSGGEKVISQAAAHLCTRVHGCLLIRAWVFHVFLQCKGYESVPCHPSCTVSFHVVQAYSM